MMTVSRRSIITAAGVGLLPFAVANAADEPSAASLSSGVDSNVTELLRQTEVGNAALMRGDIKTYRETVVLTDDFTLMSPFGGQPGRASTYTEETWQAIGRFFKNGTFEQEVVQTYSSADMVVLAIIERTNAEVGGLPAQDWALRVTLVYRREGSQWKLAHRHADPLVESVSLEQAAAVARGERDDDKRM